MNLDRDNAFWVYADYGQLASCPDNTVCSFYLYWGIRLQFVFYNFYIGNDQRTKMLHLAKIGLSSDVLYFKLCIV